MTDSTAPGPVADVTGEEMTESLLGFDEIAIAQRFNQEWTAMGDTRPIMLLRALVFVHKRRQGLPDAEAYEAAMNTTVKCLNTYFVPEPEDEGLEEPETEVGKGSSSPATALTSSPPSASTPDSAPTPPAA